jgi:hypothetical protein
MLHYKNTSYFNTFETRRDNNNGSYGFPIHISVIRSENVELLRLLLKIDPKLTKKKLYRDGENPLACLCQRPHFPTQFKMLDALLEVDSSAETISCAMVFCFQKHDVLKKDVDVSPGRYIYIYIYVYMLKRNVNISSDRSIYIYFYFYTFFIP